MTVLRRLITDWSRSDASVTRSRATTRRCSTVDHQVRSRQELMQRLGVAPQPAQFDDDRALHHELGLTVLRPV